MRLSPIIDEGVFKAGAERSETRGAAEVQEDEDTQVEIPVDQVVAMFLEICINQCPLFFFLSSFVLSAPGCSYHMLVRPSQVLACPL